MGGYGYGSSGSSGELNDLWMYNMILNQWKWMGGSQSNNQIGVFGTQGVYNTSNQPGSRGLHTLVFDNAKSVYLFGGYGKGSSSGMGDLNDI
jgi:hypothetical protein